MAMAMHTADAIPMMETWLKVRGRETRTKCQDLSVAAVSNHSLPMIAVTAWNTTVQAPPSLKVFKTVRISVTIENMEA
jgi:uncharacterized membrane protein YcgQ (UPF0703/DUF1980 family)